MTSARVIVTRPAHDATHWVQQLQQAGIDAEAFPLIEIAPVSGAASVQALNDAWRCAITRLACLSAAMRSRTFSREIRFFRSLHLQKKL